MSMSKENITFENLNLHPNITKAVLNRGYTNPTPIQSRSIPPILEGRDILASAQTGTGKTAAFMLPILHRLSEQTSKNKTKAKVLILTPTRELATQITVAADQYGKFLNLNIVSLVGGMSYHQQIRNLSKRVDIVVATPGRLLDHMDNKRLDLSNIEMLVLDEADRMLDMGFIDDVREIASSTPDSRQTLLFSATVDSKISGIVRELLKDPVRVDVSERMSPVQIKQELYLVDHAQHKTQIFEHLLNNKSIFKAIIFSATKMNADRLAKKLRDLGYRAGALHGDLSQNVRNRVIQQLHEGKIQYLVATDVASRGLDIRDISHVINFDLPKFCEDYVHRIGRTGRAGKSGVAISLALPTDARHIQRIERFTGQRFETSVIEGLEPKQNTRQVAAPQKKKRSKGGSRGSRFAESASSNREGRAPRGGDRDRSFKSAREDRGSYRRDAENFGNSRDAGARSRGGERTATESRGARSGARRRDAGSSQEAGSRSWGNERAAYSRDAAGGRSRGGERTATEDRGARRRDAGYSRDAGGRSRDGQRTATVEGGARRRDAGYAGARTPRDGERTAGNSRDRGKGRSLRQDGGGSARFSRNNGDRGARSEKRSRD